MLTALAFAAWADTSTQLDRLSQEANALVLSGDGLPQDYLAQLSAMPPDQRVLAIIYLRRLGLMTGEPIRADALLAAPGAMGKTRTQHD